MASHDNILECIEPPTKRRKPNQESYRTCKTCKTCHVRKSVNEFWRGLRCKLCRNNHVKTRRNTLSGRLATLVTTARASTKDRQLTGRSMCDSTLTISDLTEILESQQGQCYYSGLKLTTVTGDPFFDEPRET
jgi:hypothetical protein